MCSAQVPYHKKVWWKNIPSTCFYPSGHCLCFFSSTKAWRWSTGIIYPALEMPSVAGCSLSRIILLLQDSCLVRESVDHKRAWHFLSLTKNFLHLSLYFFYPHSYWSSFTRGSFLGKRNHPSFLSALTSSWTLPGCLQELAQYPAKMPQQLIPFVFWRLSSSPAAFASLTGDIALFLVAWLSWLGWKSMENTLRNYLSPKENSPL